ncbi:MAG: ankyrin repeat domain-containing protein [Melioribacteraceae bacterium]|nr:ankyrin repeat domain-containing protein [Melioribacteraceae bacterium]
MKIIINLLLPLMLISIIGCGNQEKSAQLGEEKVSPPKLDLHAAIYMRDLEAVKQHIKYGTDVNVPEPSRKSTPLITAAALGEPEAAKILIEAGADLNYKNMDGSSALLTAIVFGKEKVVKILIDSGADLNIKSSDGSTPLHTASFFAEVDIVKALLEKGADKSLTNNDGKTALQIVEPPFEKVKFIYDAVGEGIKPLGLELDYTQIKNDRPIIAQMLK